MRLSFPLLLAALCLMPGIAAAAQMQRGTINVQGAARTYSFALPGNYDAARAYPIVMVLHGGEGSGEKIARQTGFASYVDRGSFIAVFPDAGGRQWNDGRRTTQSNQNDVAFLAALAQEMAMRYGHDPARVFVGGISNGGMMTQRLACETTNIFSGYAVLNGNMPADLVGGCRPARPVPMVFFFAPTDPLVPWNGGEIKKGRNSGAGGQVISVPATVDFWTRFDGCGNPRTGQVAHQGKDDTSVKVYDFGACGVTFYEIDGGGHTWPGGEAHGPFIRRIVGETTHDIDATAAILDFFRRHGM